MKGNNQKTFTAPLGIDSKFFLTSLPSLVRCKTKAVVGAVFTPLANRFLIANCSTRWHCSFKGLSQDGGREKFAEISAPLPLIRSIPQIARSISVESTLKQCRERKLMQIFQNNVQSLTVYRFPNKAHLLRPYHILKEFYLFIILINIINIILV
jgi:hypothetical protein